MTGHVEAGEGSSVEELHAATEDARDVLEMLICERDTARADLRECRDTCVQLQRELEAARRVATVLHERHEAAMVESQGVSDLLFDVYAAHSLALEELCADVPKARAARVRARLRARLPRDGGRFIPVRDGKLDG